MVCSWRMPSRWRATSRSSWTLRQREPSLCPLAPPSSLTRCLQRRSKCSSTPSSSWAWRWPEHFVYQRYISFLQVIWKWDKEMPGLPDNILLRFDLYWKLSLKAHFSSSWLPQQDLLAHPNLKVRSKDNFPHSLSLEGFCHTRGSWQSCRGDLP